MKNVLITGGASGLGAALAKYYAQKGWSVCIADIQQTAGEALAKALSSDYSVDCFFLKLDVTNDASWLEAVNVIVNRWKTLDAIINNAGVASSGDIDSIDMSDFQWTMDINVMGVAKGCHYFVPLLKESQGNLINVASMAGLLHMPSMSAYNASKAAVVALSETLCSELDPYGVKVSVLCPAFFKTNLTQNMRSTTGQTQKMVNRWMADSTIQAEDIAAKVFNESASGKFLILTHKRENFVWRIKRFLPALYLVNMKGIAKKMKAKFESSPA